MSEPQGLAPIGWFVGQALETLAELYQQIAKNERRYRDSDATIRAHTMDKAAVIAIEAAEKIRRELCVQDYLDRRAARMH